MFGLAFDGFYQDRAVLQVEDAFQNRKGGGDLAMLGAHYRGGAGWCAAFAFEQGEEAFLLRPDVRRNP